VSQIEERKMVTAKRVSKVPVSPKSFFRCFLPEFYSQRMLNPEEIIKHFDGAIPKAVTLRSCHDRLWRVKVCMAENGLFLENGWLVFLKDNDVEEGDFIVFSYDGNCVFDFQIFGRTACLKEKIAVEEEVEECGSRKLEVQSKPPRECSVKQKLTMKRPRGRPPKHRALKRKSRGDVSATTKVHDGRWEGAVSPTNEEDENRIPHHIRPKNPYFLARVDKRNYFVNVPLDVINGNGIILPPKLTLLDCDGRTWTSEVQRWYDGRLFLHGGWANFIRQHKVRRTDCCICEFLQGRGRKNYIIEIHIIRA
ncbi:B3 DNA binding domain, partial [Dillenia turbinata]